MPESLNVIALISGGKDSFYSLLHCLQNGHKIVALGNLFPPPGNPASTQDAKVEDEQDLNSFMYQTVGHTVIPLYEKALGIPLFREMIVGSAVQTGTSYGHPDVPAEGSKNDSKDSRNQEQDETESLVPLLKRIIAAHPSANALSTGAILSTYQRTRIESVAIRLGLVPLAYLWQYPILPPGTQASLLQDISSVGLDARIVKVASGGLDESFLWENVASAKAVSRIEKSMKQYGTNDDGAILGEGGEFETLVIDGPAHLFKGRIEILRQDREVIREGGGSAWLRILKAKVVFKSPGHVMPPLRVPDLLESNFDKALQTLRAQSSSIRTHSAPSHHAYLSAKDQEDINRRVWHWCCPRSSPKHTGVTILESISLCLNGIEEFLTANNLTTADVISTMILLRSMEDFAVVNKSYCKLFKGPDPPARVTVSCGDLLPEGVNIRIQISVLHPEYGSSPDKLLKKALHVQSRSYWAPANIGPYSQAISTPVKTISDESLEQRAVAVAGQIPLIPQLMSLSSVESISPHLEVPKGEDFRLQAVLSFQHLWRIGMAMQVSWWTGVVAYLSRGSLEDIKQRASVASKTWAILHDRPVESVEDDDESMSTPSIDLWEQRHHFEMVRRGVIKPKKTLPDWSLLSQHEGYDTNFTPPFFAIEVEELPRKSEIEWHSLLGIANGPIEFHCKRGLNNVAYGCSFGDETLTVIAVEYSESQSDVVKRLRCMLQNHIGLTEHKTIPLRLPYLAYGDMSVIDLDQLHDGYGDMIPCRSLWDGEGNRLAAVLVYDGLSWSSEAPKQNDPREKHIDEAEGERGLEVERLASR